MVKSEDRSKIPKTLNIVKGRFINVNGIVVRIRNRTDGCNGCYFNNSFTCPEIGGKKYDCRLRGIIFTKQ